MKAMSVERDFEKGESDHDTAQLFNATPRDLNDIYATGPLKPPKFECCKFR